MTALLEYVEIHELRHVEPGSRVEFGHGINVILGRNGAGKTTLLSLVSALKRNNFHQFIRENFRISFRFVDATAALDGTLTNIVTDERVDFRFAGDFTFGAEHVHIESKGNESVLEHRGRRFEGHSVLPAVDEHAHAFDLMHMVRLRLPDDPALNEIKAGARGLAVDVFDSHNEICIRTRQRRRSARDGGQLVEKQEAPTSGWNRPTMQRHRHSHPAIAE